MALTREVVLDKAQEYAESEPLYAVESENIETLPQAYRSGNFGWRDAVWVVRWYYRRYLGDYPDDQRRVGEAAFGDNEFDEVRSAITEAASADDVDTKFEALTSLEAVTIPIASAFLMFLDPDDYIVIGDREWRVLADAGDLDPDVPEPFTAEDYTTYLGACRHRCEAFDCSMWTLYRAIWRLGTGN
jgi:hypothetical protein